MATRATRSSATSFRSPGGSTGSAAPMRLRFPRSTPKRLLSLTDMTTQRRDEVPVKRLSSIRIVRRVLALSALSGALLAAALALGATPAFAAYTARVQGGTLKVTGDGVSDKLALLVSGSSNTVQVDVGEDNTVDVSFDRTTFTAIDVQAGGGDDEIRVVQT